MLKLKNVTLSNIQNKVGMPMQEILDRPAEELDRRIENKIGKKLEVVPLRDKRLAGRGSALLSRLGRTAIIDKRMMKI